MEQGILPSQESPDNLNEKKGDFMSSYYGEFKVSVPEGKSGSWEVKRFEVTKHDEEIDRLRAVINGRGRYCPAGTYTKLSCNGVIVMSDTRDEIRDHRYFIEEAEGNILISGLGLGMVLNGCLKKPEVAHATVIEISPDVINLVGNYYMRLYGDRLTIINADIMEWKPPKGVKYDYIWHDIWDAICSDNLKQMTKLHRKFSKVTVKSQGSWCERECRRLARS
jgi:hypothetical protein